ncbi:MAG: VOC family protein [Acidimicrobiales bacterium]
MPPVWTVYVAVDDADATAAAVTGAGGMVAQPPFVINADGQRIAIVLDPANAALGIFEGSADNGIRVLDEPGAPCWFDCRTRNADASEAFYRSLFGWSFTAMDGPMDYRVAELGGQPIAGLMAMGDEVPAAVPSHWGVSFSVPDADAAAELTASRGGSVTMPPMDTPFGRSVSLVDPWGAAFMVIDRSSATT